MFSQEKKNEIAALVEKKIKSRSLEIKCPMCGNKHFIIADGYFTNTMQDGFDHVALGGPMIPSVPIVCDNCGFISQHAVGILGIKI